MWLLCIASVVFIVALATKGFTGTVQQTNFGNSDLFIPLFLGLIGIGVLAFCILVLAIFTGVILEKKVLVIKKSPKGVAIFGLKLFLLLAVFPLFLLWKIRRIKPIFSRLIAVLVVSIILLPVWAGGYTIISVLVGSQLGLVRVSISVSGTGSMYPTFPKGQGKTPEEQGKEVVDTPGMFPYPNGLTVFGRRLLGHVIGRGDIVVVENEKIRESTKKLYGEPSGWVKRVIATSGDSIELRDGVVYLNDEPLKETFTAKPHSTFGQAFLQECKRVVVPEGSIFIIGDNRKGSGDSREIGFIEIEAVKYVLPFNKQKGGLDKNWRDTSADLGDSSKIKLNKDRYIQLLNEQRGQAGVKLLKYQQKLEQSAFKRGEAVLKYDDLSYEATKSGYTQLKAMNQVGYSNITYGEVPVLGYYEAEELIENQFEFPESKKFFLEKDFQEVGVAEVQGEINGCPTQVMVQHFAGYVPPNYTKDVIESWKTTLSQLKEVFPSWDNIRNFSATYNANKQDADRLLEIMRLKISRIETIVSKMEANKWLTNEENRWIKEDESLYNEQTSIAKRLNAQVWR